MGEILGLGLSHFPPLSSLDDRMAGLFRWALSDPDLPRELRDPTGWPAAARKEWGDDSGMAAATRHRDQLVSGLARVRRSLDAFAPDVLVVWGDDQYENFREDLVPAVAVLAYDRIVAKPWHERDEMQRAIMGEANVWGEGDDTTFEIPGRRDIATYLVGGLLEEGIDIAYAYEPRHHPSLPHAFMNTVLFLDYERAGFDYPMIPMPINCYGRRVISYRGFAAHEADKREPDPPSPNPARLMDIGRATARVLAASPWRVALVASSSWSHAFLCDKNWRLRPDTPADRRLYDWLRAGEYDRWREVSLDEVEDSGQHEVLNWFALAGAMQELDSTLEWSEFVETSIFNSNKVFAAFEPV